ncbi:MAG TPA: hypothetical protein VMR28_02060 [Candidatus Saccharimonadales bacterium]|nr:hypothetical protein [Candidatus Saccharimonadales bacterium]
MSKHPFGEELTHMPGWKPPLSEEDEAEAAKIAKDCLGNEIEAEGIGCYVRGVQGDGATYSEAVIITDPNISEHVDDWDEYLEKLGDAAREIGNTIFSAGNVVIDITNLRKP